MTAKANRWPIPEESATPDRESRPLRTALGRELRIRSMVTVAGEVIPFVWPMRSFVHHNPLHGLEHMPFHEAVERASALFGSRGFLRRTDYQWLLRAGRIDADLLDTLIGEHVAETGSPWQRRDQSSDRGALARILKTLLTQEEQPVGQGEEVKSSAVLARLRWSAGRGQ